MEFEPPGLEYVMTEYGSPQPVTLRKIPNLPAGGERWSISGTGGTFEGPRLRGRVLPGSLENPHLRPDDVLMINARRILETDDGEHIWLQNRGIRRAYHDPVKMVAWRTKSAPVTASDFYFRVAPVFETASGKYDWLTRHLFVGMLIDPPAEAPKGTTLAIRYFMVL